MEKGKEEKVVRRNRKCSVTKTGKKQKQKTLVWRKRLSKQLSTADVKEAGLDLAIRRKGTRVSGFRRGFTQGPVCNELENKMETLGKEITY